MRVSELIALAFLAITAAAFSAHVGSAQTPDLQCTQLPNVPDDGTPLAAGLNDLYRVPEIVTRGRFPERGESDSTWRTQEARHVGSDTIAPGF